MPRCDRGQTADAKFHRRAAGLRIVFHRRAAKRGADRRRRHEKRHQKGRDMLKKTPRVKAFTGPNAEERAERVGMWFKAITGQVAARVWCIDAGVGLTKA